MVSIFTYLIDHCLPGYTLRRRPYHVYAAQCLLAGGFRLFRQRFARKLLGRFALGLCSVLQPFQHVVRYVADDHATHGSTPSDIINDITTIGASKGSDQSPSVTATFTAAATSTVLKKKETMPCIKTRLRMAEVVTSVSDVCPVMPITYAK